MSNPIKPPGFSGPLPSAPPLAAPHHEQPQEIRNTQESQLALFAATRDAGKIGYGALAFWIVVAVLVAARIAFLDPSKSESTSSLFGTKAASAWITGGSPSPQN
jgi:hypothetical protein